MAKELLYLHFGRQCPGTTYFGERARETAELLGMPYRAVDIAQEPEYAVRHQLFCPGTLVIDDFQLMYPGRPEEMAESYRLRGPLPGQHDYQPRPDGTVDQVEVLGAASCGSAFRCCLPSLNAEQEQAKAEWLRDVRGESFAGLIGYRQQQLVGYVELLPETDVPYPLDGTKRSDGGFITCLYSPIDWGLEQDYRVSLMQHLLIHARQHGYRSLSVVSGEETPYPNGPVTVFTRLGFERVKYLGRILMRHKWEDAWLLRKQLAD